MTPPLEEIVVPCVIFGAIIFQYAYAIKSGTYGPATGKSPRAAIAFFRKMRSGWVDQNHLTGQAAVNTTRDYIRVVVFLASNAIVSASILAGFALGGNTTNDQIMIVKLGACVGVLIVIFLLLLMCLRYMLHFSFMINVKQINGKTISKRMMTLLFDQAHMYYSIAIRLYYFLVPLFAWIFSVWVLAVVGLMYLFMINKLEDISFLEKEIYEIMGVEGEESEKDVEIGRVQMVSQKEI